MERLNQISHHASPNRQNQGGSFSQDQGDVISLHPGSLSLQDDDDSPRSRLDPSPYTQDKPSFNMRNPHNQECHILQLAPELISSITDHLSLIDHVLLSQTCRSLRAALSKRHLNADRLSRDEYIGYLATRARGLPDEWMCEKCMTLHPIDETDTPTAINRSSCPLMPHSLARLGNLGREQIHICHRHIQLALKYTRLRHHEYDSYLKALLEPYHDTGVGLGAYIPLKVHYSAYPRVVTDHDGNVKFLLLSTWRYYEGCKEMLLRSLGYHQICPHLEWNYCNCSKGFCRGSCRLGYCHVLHAAAEAVIDARRDGQRTGACPRCPTDFSIQITSEYMDLYVWQDFGPECSPIDLAWTVHYYDGPCEGSLNWREAGPTLDHRPGSARKLYESESESII
ncbi:hypothetical protein GGR53DRAFT_443391 [Hypoxylon sp. FL1150]|nr:hypothetical protein GGR53DRAFT_443391 [Hypoxylon sp. FL1150]